MWRYMYIYIYRKLLLEVSRTGVVMWVCFPMAHGLSGSGCFFFFDLVCHHASSSQRARRGGRRKG